MPHLPLCKGCSLHQTEKYCNPLPPQQVSRLLATPKFQEHSGVVLDSLSTEEDANQCFEFAAPPEAYPVSCPH
jgi:hypothetical protein